MTTRLSPSASASTSSSTAASTSTSTTAVRPSLQPFPSPPKPSTWPRRQTHHTPQIDLSQIEIVDLTDPPPTAASKRQRPSAASSAERSAKRANKGKDKEAYISLEDDDDLLSPSPPPSQASPAGSSGRREKSPLQGGLLSLHKCVICLDSPTDLVATPCGHLFCDFCIRSALKSSQDGRGRGVPLVFSGACPICRGRISTKNLIPLEIKVRTLG